jgi:2-oxoglutarate ferredoxin oxidoreductase subunit alpha
MTPVILLTDGYIANGSQIFKIPKMADLKPVNPPLAKANDPDYKPFRRDADTLVRKWALPGTEGLRHRVGGLEKENIFGNVSTDPANHHLMVQIRQAKVDKVADFIPEQQVLGEPEGDLLVVSWGGTEGAVKTAVAEMQRLGKNVSMAHFNYIMPLPKNTEKILGSFKKIIVCELNNGQFIYYLRMKLPQFKYLQYNKVQSLPFTMEELTDEFNKILNSNA